MSGLGGGVRSLSSLVLDDNMIPVHPHNYKTDSTLVSELFPAQF